jgi:hypothetical protein
MVFTADAMTSQTLTEWPISIHGCVVQTEGKEFQEIPATGNCSQVLDKSKFTGWTNVMP